MNTGANGQGGPKLGQNFGFLPYVLVAAGK